MFVKLSNSNFETQMFKYNPGNCVLYKTKYSSKYSEATDLQVVDTLTA